MAPLLRAPWVRGTAPAIAWASSMTACVQYASELMILASGLAGAPFLESRVDAAHHRFEWNAGVLPCLNQRPIERGEQKRPVPRARRKWSSTSVK